MKPVQPTVAQFKRWIRNPPATPKLILYTQELAYEALVLNLTHDGARGRNRPLRRSAVLEFKRRMDAGEWKLTPQGVAFDVDGFNQDGQHRLNAALDAENPVAMWTHFGQSKTLLPYYDIGVKRTSGDLFSMRGVNHANTTAAIVRQENVYRTNSYGGNASGHPKLGTPEEVWDYYVNLGAVAVAEAVRMHQLLTKNKIPKATVLAALYLVALQDFGASATDFWAGIATGIGVGPASVEKKLREHLFREGKEIKSTQAAADVARAWNTKRAGGRKLEVSESKTVPRLR